jgi:hypothetical protein
VTSAGRFLDATPGLRAVRGSAAFADLKQAAALEIDDEVLYIVRGDTVGDEDELLVESLVLGARSTRDDDPARRLYLELGQAERRAVDDRVAGR